MHFSEKLENKTELLTESSRSKIDVWIKKFPQERKQSALIAALFIAQEQNHGYLSKDLIAAVADYLQIPRVSAEEAATFYSMYEQNPVGKNVISVCTNVSCLLCGSKDIVKHLKNKLNIGFNETTSDGTFTLKEVECLGACVGAPVMRVGSKYYENLTSAKIDEILKTLETNG